MATLYEINQQLANFEFECDPETGELLNAPAWDGLNMAYEEKVENIACYIKNLLSDSQQLREEEKALASRRTAAEKKAERLKRLLEENMGGQNFSTARCAVSFKKNPPAVKIADESAFINWAMGNGKDELLSYKSPTPNKTAIKTALKNGEQLNGCELSQSIGMTIK